MDGLEIGNYEGDGYKPLINAEKFLLAEIRWAKRFDKDGIDHLSVHLTSDEAFVLLQGEATLLIGNPPEKVELEKFRYYNVKAGTWHGIVVSKDARVLIAENPGTTNDRTIPL